MANKRTTLRAGRDTDVRKLAGAIAKCFTNDGSTEIEITSIGAGATNQAVKALATAQSFLEKDGIEIVITPRYNNVEMDGEMITSICHEVKRA